MPPLRNQPSRCPSLHAFAATPLTCGTPQELDEAAPPDADSPAPGPSARTKYGIAQLPAPVPTLRPQLDKPLPRLGVGECPGPIQLGRRQVV